MSQFMRKAILVWIVVCSLGCSRKSLDPFGSETLIGRWRAVTKDDADQGNANQDARTPSGTVAFRYEFKADHSYQTSVEITGGLMSLMPQFAGKHAVQGTWNVVEVGRDVLTVELPNLKLAAAGFPAIRVKVVFQTRDRCVFNADSEEALVLTRLP
jgi:hypothetical protein